MMKKYRIILGFTICTLTLMMNSCKEDDLLLTNPNELDAGSFFKNEAQVQSAVNAVYANLQTQGLYNRNMYFSMDNMGQDNDGNSQLEADKRSMLEFTFTASDPLIIGAYWNSCYRGINKANFVIGNTETINEILSSELSDELKQKYIGEAKFMRALYYFYLTTRFGDIPMPLGIPEGTEGLPKSTREAVYAQIVLDLQDASSGLLATGTDDIGRATRGAAIALLGKTYLFMGEHGLALAEFQKIYGQYSLEANYFDNFTEEGEHGPESIWEVEHNDELSTAQKWDGQDSGTASGGNEATFRAQEYGHLNWFNVYPSDDLLDEYEVGDSRYQSNFYSEGDAFAGGIMAEIGNGRRAGWKKYQNYHAQASEDQDSGINSKVIRYSDVLLMMAECENEVGTQDNAVDYINEVRSRPDVMLPDVADGLTKTQVFDAIKHERQVELPGEQCRFNDVIRWGIAETELAGTTGGANFQSKHYLWPIPSAEITSNVNLTQADQNPGY